MIKLGMVSLRNSFRRRYTTCTDGAARRRGACLPLSRDGFPSLGRPLLGRVLPQSVVSLIRMIVAEVFTNQPAQVGLTEHDHVIQQLPPAAPYPAFGPPPGLLPSAASLGRETHCRALRETRAGSGGAGWGSLQKPATPPQPTPPSPAAGSRPA